MLDHKHSGPLCFIAAGKFAERTGAIKLNHQSQACSFKQELFLFAQAEISTYLSSGELLDQVFFLQIWSLSMLILSQAYIYVEDVGTK